ncbi:hypothetical protein [Bartonella sp. HY761]|uniref:hypothetical protein n=1 Tax=Bartonella sp. HY761 TaxID=2979330 RepID=UPI0021E21A87|nr:hypothetical protein [Bartonella sp. HY761]UXN07986.1 hypothetical protein N6A79_15375 [Bartonella sp. HY761]
MFKVLQNKSLRLTLKIILSALLVLGGAMPVLAQQQIVTKIQDFEFKDNKFIIQTDDGEFYATLFQQDEDGITRFLMQLSSLKEHHKKVYIEKEDAKILAIQGLSCQPLEFLKEDDDFIYMIYGIAPGIMQINKHNDVLYNKYLQHAAVIKRNSHDKNKRFLEFASTNEGIVEYMGGLCPSSDI